VGSSPGSPRLVTVAARPPRRPGGAARWRVAARPPRRPGGVPSRATRT